MGINDPRVDLAGQRVEEFLHDAAYERLVLAARRARAQRRRWSLWRRVIAPRLASTVQAVNDVVGAIVDQAWPSPDAPTPPLRPSSGQYDPARLEPWR